MADLIFPRELTPLVSDVLGLMIFKTQPIAHCFRLAGEAIPYRIEDEQAFVLHWLLTLVLEFGDDWQAKAHAVLAEKKRIAMENVKLSEIPKQS